MVGCLSRSVGRPVHNAQMEVGVGHPGDDPQFGEAGAGLFDEFLGRL